jgi:hypothetical protein
MSAISFKVLAGDLPQGRQRIQLQSIKSAELQTEDKLKKLAGSAGWGFAGAIVGGLLTRGIVLAVGGLTGILSGGNKIEVCFSCELQDGRKFLAVTSKKNWQRILAATFSKVQAQLTQIQVTNETLNENKNDYQNNGGKSLQPINQAEIVRPFLEGYKLKPDRKPDKALHESSKLILITFLALGVISSLFSSVSSLFLNASVKPNSTLSASTPLTSTSLNQEKSRELTNREICIGTIDETVEKSFKLKGKEANEHLLLIKKLYLDTNINGATFLDVCRQDVSKEELDNLITAVNRLANNSLNY